MSWGGDGKTPGSYDPFECHPTGQIAPNREIETHASGKGIELECALRSPLRGELTCGVRSPPEPSSESGSSVENETPDIPTVCEEKNSHHWLAPTPDLCVRDRVLLELRGPPIPLPL